MIEKLISPALAAIPLLAPFALGLGRLASASPRPLGTGFPGGPRPLPRPARLGAAGGFPFPRYRTDATKAEWVGWGELPCPVAVYDAPGAAPVGIAHVAGTLPGPGPNARPEKLWRIIIEKGRLPGVFVLRRGAFVEVEAAEIRNV
jgi:hypothetical protein